MSVAGDDWNTPVEMGASPVPTPGAPYYADWNRPPVQGSPFSQRPQVASDWDRAIPAGQPASLPIPGTAPTETPVALGAQRLPNVDPGDPMSVAGDDWNTPVEMGGPTPEMLAAFQRNTGTPFNPGSWLDRNKLRRMMDGAADWSDSTVARAMGQGAAGPILAGN